MAYTPNIFTYYIVSYFFVIRNTKDYIVVVRKPIPSVSHTLDSSPYTKGSLYKPALDTQGEVAFENLFENDGGDYRIADFGLSKVRKPIPSVSHTLDSSPYTKGSLKEKAEAKNASANIIRFC